MLTNTKEMLKKAQVNGYAVGHFNIHNLEWTQAILTTAQENKSPVILATSEGGVKYMGGVNTVVAIVKALIKDLNITVPVALHLDHGDNVAICKKAIDAGYTSVMYDGSLLPFEENLKNTKVVVEYAKAKNVSVEAEVGTVGGNEDGIVGGVHYASLEECKGISAAGIDSLAASLGSVHGHYQGKPNLGFKEMELYAKETKLPLVLHGGSGIPDDQIQKAIKSGEAKINVSTELQENFTKGIRRYIEEGKDQTETGFDPRKLIKTYGFQNIKETVSEKMKLFNSINKA